MAPITTTAIQVLSISTALVASGGIATLSLFDVPILKAQPAERSLPGIRWLFSRGSHIFPSAAFISSAGFTYLTFAAVIPLGGRTIRQVLATVAKSDHRASIYGYLVAALLTFAIAPITQYAMVPTNFKLIELNEKNGGYRSAESQRLAQTKTATQRQLESPASTSSGPRSVNSIGEASQWTDVSGPQTRTANPLGEDYDEKTRELLDKFGKLNMVRAVCIGAGGLIGLVAALT